MNVSRGICNWMTSILMILDMVLITSTTGAIPRVPYTIAVILNPESDPSLNFVIESAIKRYNKSNSVIVNNRMFHLEIIKVCDKLKRGFLVLIQSIDHNSISSVHSLINRLQIPTINLALPHRLLPEASQQRFDVNPPYAVSIRPRVDKLLAEWIYSRQWTDVIFLYDTDQDVVLMERVFEWLRELEARHRPTVTQAKHTLYTHIQCRTEILRMPQDTEVPDDVDMVEDPIQQFLYDLHRTRYNTSSGSEQHIIVATSNGRRQSKVLQALETVSLQSPEMFHYVFVDFGIPPSTMERMRTRFINMTTFDLVNRTSSRYVELESEYQQFINDIKDTAKKDVVDDLPPTVYQPRLPLEAILLYDAIELSLAAIQSAEANGSIDVFKLYHRGQFFNFEFPGIYCHPKEDAEFKDRQMRPFIYGKNISHHMRTIELSEKRTLTGVIRFDNNGLRQDNQIHIWDLSWDMRTPVVTARETNLTWTNAHGFVNSDAPSIDMSAANKTERKFLRVVTVPTHPFTMPYWDEQTGELKFQGYCIDLIEKLSKKMHFDYKVHLVKDMRYGSVNPDKTWNGMIGELIREEADMAVAPLTITKVRERVVDFSKPFITTGISIMIKKPDRSEFAVFSFLEPLSRDIWVHVIVATVGVSLVIFVVARCSPLEEKARESLIGGGTTSVSIGRDFSLYNCVWFTFAAFVQQGTDMAPQCVAVRIASGSWWFFTLIILASYTANLAAFLTSEKLMVGIDSVEALAGQTQIKYGIQANGSTQEFFQYSAFPTYQRMWRYMSRQDPTVLVSSYSEGIQRVKDSKGSYAFLLENTANQYANTRKPCDTMKVGDLLNQVGYGVATKFGSPYRHQLNLAILDLHEKGDLKKLENKWWYDRGQCDMSTGQKDSGASSLEMSKVAGCFYILVAGLLVSMITAYIEHEYRSRKQAKRLMVMKVFGEAVRVVDMATGSIST